VPEPDGLDAVPWSRLEHAFGSADDVPEMIRGLRSPSEREREKALEALRTTIWHQETVYSATPHAVPFLARVALDEAVDSKTRLWVVHLLAWISASEGRNAVGRRTQLEHVHAAREALAPFLPRFEGGSKSRRTRTSPWPPSLSWDSSRSGARKRLRRSGGSSRARAICGELCSTGWR
jgi:hypothetical protein